MKLGKNTIINPEARVLQGTNMENLAGSIRHEINKFRESYGFNISQWANDRKVIGTIYSLSLMGDIKSPNLFVSCQQFYIGLYCSNTSPYYFLLQEISNNFSPSIINRLV